MPVLASGRLASADGLIGIVTGEDGQKMLDLVIKAGVPQFGPTILGSKTYKADLLTCKKQNVLVDDNGIAHREIVTFCAIKVGIDLKNLQWRKC